MNTRTYFTVILIGISIHLTAQYKAGVRIGGNLNQVDVTGTPELISDMTKVSTGIKVGGFIEKEMIDDFSLSAELNYSKKGFSMSEGTSFGIFGIDIPIGIRSNVNLHYLELPVMGKYYFKNDDQLKFSVEAGPSMGYALTGKIEPRATLGLDYNLPEINIDFGGDNYRRIEWAGNIGLGAELPIANTTGSFVADVRYTKSFTNVLEDRLIDIDVKNKSWSARIGYAVNF